MNKNQYLQMIYDRGWYVHPRFRIKRRVRFSLRSISGVLYKIEEPAPLLDLIETTGIDMYNYSIYR